MKRNGFTFIEMLVAIVVIFVIVLLALPMQMVRAKKSEQMNAKSQLMQIKESQEKYRMEHGSYTSDPTKLANWKTNTKRYRFQVEYADSSRFVAQAAGDLDDDKICENVWSIDQSGTLTKIQ